MIKPRATLRLQGSAFSPSSVEERTGLRFTASQERGELGRLGRYAGRPIPYGSAELACTVNSALLASPDEEFFGAAERLVRAGEALGVESAVLHVDIEFESQCNFEFSQAFLAAVLRIGAPLTVSCYEAEGTEEFRWA